MNKNYYDYAMQLIKNLSTDELEKQLVEFGFEVQRKVPLYSAQEIFDDFSDLPVNTLFESLGAFDALLALYAANDNNYALAA